MGFSRCPYFNSPIKWLCLLLLELALIGIGIVTVNGYPSSSNLNGLHEGSSYRVGDMPRYKKSYAGYKLLRTEPIGLDNVPVLENMDGVHGIHFWTYPLANRTVDIFTSPKQLSYVQTILKDLGLEHDVIFHDADEIIRQEQPVPDAQEQMWDGVPEQSYGNETELPIGTTRAISPDFFSRYQRYNDILTFANQLAKEHPSIASLHSIGKSYEGRDIGILKISTGNSGGGGLKPAIFIDGGMHAREWISPSTVAYIMYKLLKDPNSAPLIDMFDWYIVPVLNVDGYEYTHTTDRYWRKTRSRSSNGCYGVDPNRNFAFHWAESGSSSKPCSDIYHGPRSFSEVEAQALGRTLMNLKNQVKLYLTFHAYSQMWLVPWGYAKNQKPADYNELMRLARYGKTALERTYGTQYSLGTAPDLLYPAAGGSDDWAKGVAGIPYAYCLELRDKGRYGFALPPNQIKGTGEETFNGVAAIAKELHRTLKRQARAGEFTNADLQLHSPSDENQNTRIKAPSS